MSKIGIFGGSFDPVHEGHIHLANLAREAAELDEVWFLPCYISPHKKGRPPTPGEIRVKWLELALADIPWAKIETLELRDESPSYSWHTMQMLAEEHPQNEWFWIMGGDQWTALHTWSKPEILSELASFIVLARDGLVISERPGYRLQSVHGEHPASSTEIRRALAAGEKEIPFLHSAVEQAMKSDF